MVDTTELLIVPVATAAVQEAARRVDLQKVRQWLSTKSLNLASGKRFTILIASLAGDTADQKQTKHVIQTFRSQFRAESPDRAFDVIQYPKILKSGEYGDLSEKDLKASDKGQEWLLKQKADLLVWGEVASDSLLRLRFTTLQSSEAEVNPYQLQNDTFELQQDFKADIEIAIAGVAFAAVLQASEGNHALVVEIRHWLPKLKEAVHNGQGTFGQAAFSTLAYSSGVAFHHHGHHSRDLGSLHEAEKMFRLALKAFSELGEDTNCAVAHGAIGNVLSTIGSVDGNSEHAVSSLDQAIIELLAVIDHFNMLGATAEWATAKNGIGIVFGKLANTIPSISVADYCAKNSRYHLEEVAEKISADMFPLEWAVTQQNLAMLWLTAGKRNDGARAQYYLQKAVNSFELALRHRSRVVMPHRWAMTHMGLAEACYMLAIVTASMGEDQGSWVVRSTTASYDALKELQRNNAPAAWIETILVYAGALEYGWRALDRNEALQHLTTVLENLHNASSFAQEVQDSALADAIALLTTSTNDALGELESTSVRLR